MTMPETYPPDKEQIEYRERPLTFFDGVGRLVGILSIIVVVLYILFSVLFTSVWLLNGSVHLCSSDGRSQDANYRCESW